MSNSFGARPEIKIRRIEPSNKAGIAKVAAVIYRAFLHSQAGDSPEPVPDPYYTRPQRDGDRFRSADYSAVLGTYANFGGPDIRESQTYRLFHSFIIEATRLDHKLHVATNADGQTAGAYWMKPGDQPNMVGLPDFGFTSFVRGVAIPAIRAFGVKGMLGYAYDASRHLPMHPSSEAYLSMIGVDPDVQGQGVGKLLLNHAIENYSQGASGLHLSTMNPDNVGLYERFDFQLTDTVHTAASRLSDELTTYHMHRPAGQS